MPLLEVNNLHTYFKTEQGVSKAVNGVTFSLEERKTLGIVGESGSGKSVSALSIIKLLDENGFIAAGSIIFEGKELTKIDRKQMNEIRGNAISVIFQEPMTCLNPVLTIGRQLAEVYLIHQRIKRNEAKKQAILMLEKVQISNPEAIMKQYPHQLSGGMRQRIMIAMALACEPRILIADEPTTALDVTIQSQILLLMKELKETMGTSIIFITHDLGVIREIADEVVVMYCGQVVERGKVTVLFRKGNIQHPYTQGLLAFLPRMDTDKEKPLEVISGSVPTPLSLPKGCKFAPRCKYATSECIESEPELMEHEAEHWIRCFHATR